MSHISQFDVATAALEHLELLNCSNQNPLEIAAQFRILLRSKKEHSSYDLSKCQNAREDISSDSSDQIILTKISKENVIFHYPTINWKELRKKRYEHKLEEFISTKFKTKNCTISSLRTVSNKIELRQNLTKNSSSSRSRSSSPSIRTPSISPINFSPSTYTISRLHSTSINQNNEDIFFPIADCNLVIRHRPIQRTKRISYCPSNKIFFNK